MKFAHNALLTVAVPLLLLLSGCGEQRQQIADLLYPPEPEQAALRIDQSSEQGKEKDAIAFGERYLKSEKDPKGLVHAALAKAYLSVGDALSAQAHIAASIAPPSVQSSPNNQQGVVVGDASVTEGSNGLVVKAGDVVVSLPK